MFAPSYKVININCEEKENMRGARRWRGWCERREDEVRNCDIIIDFFLLMMIHVCFFFLLSPREDKMRNENEKKEKTKKKSNRHRRKSLKVIFEVFT